MSRVARLLLGASLLGLTTSCGGTAPAAADGIRDASADMDATDAALTSPEAGDAGSPPSIDAAVDASTCAPQAANTRVDGGFGCAASSQYMVNGNDVCSSGQYAYGCYGATAPAFLQCQEFSIPNPPDTTFYCCPCVAPTDAGEAGSDIDG